MSAGVGSSDLCQPLRGMRIHRISGILDSRFPGVESCGHTVQLLNELILAKLL